MALASKRIDTQSLLLDVGNTTLTVTPEQFLSLCIDNPDLRMELKEDGHLVVMAPTGGESGERNGNLFARVWNWNDQTKLGRIFDSSTGYDFTALGGGKPSPDVSWIEKSRLESVNIKSFIPVVPDFVIELRSESDRLSAIQAKMSLYQRLGVKLGILVNPQDKNVEVYRPGQEPQVLESPVSINCQDVMPGFMLSMNGIW